ncbi:16S rRNA processing protein RimM [Olivibacter sp. SDN3]|uniref:ribosome maturation factor RimM n=1 Tax=Olivibacter sp. SDN3 TaxID=2764720 RepID=UPI00165192DA|nr:ribosome maturation factor RimM [Olivibacter sp. SDN3]QNL51141.1 16S rRNA processing protein RimM [Olivibacter sp. SDN3]
MTINDCFYIGYISKSRGLKGEVQLYFEFEEYNDLDFDILFIEFGKKLVPFFVDSYKLQPNSTGYFYLEDVDHIDKALPLLRKAVYLPNEKKPVRNPDEFFITDLKGFMVYDRVYGELGEIIDIHSYPQQDVAVVQYRFKELMFPLNDDLILEIDREGGTLKVDLPHGLVELYSGG